MQEEMFSKVWDFLVSRYPATNHGLHSNRDKTSAEEVFWVLDQIAPSLAHNIPLAAAWVNRTILFGGLNSLDLRQLKTLSQIEFFLRASDWVSILTAKETREA